MNEKITIDASRFEVWKFVEQLEHLVRWLPQRDQSASEKFIGDWATILETQGVVKSGLTGIARPGGQRTRAALVEEGQSEDPSWEEASSWRTIEWEIIEVVPEQTLVIETRAGDSRNATGRLTVQLVGTDDARCQVELITMYRRDAINSSPLDWFTASLKFAGHLILWTLAVATGVGILIGVYILAEAIHRAITGRSFDSPLAVLRKIMADAS